MFFFSSRRRHTRCLSDWSSDVCSSDLGKTAMTTPIAIAMAVYLTSALGYVLLVRRSEERRVGKECRSRWWPDRENTKRSPEVNETKFDSRQKPLEGETRVGGDRNRSVS